MPASVLRRQLLDGYRLSKKPMVPFTIFDGTTSITVLLVCGRFDDLGTRFGSTRK
jgi:hypothetical protein